jgi:hypothetical protein
MSKQNAEVLALTARSEAESITKGDKRTIAAIITHWNECVKQSGFWCIYDFPTTGYTRKSQLVADLLRCADQLDEYVEPNPNAAKTVEQLTREFNAALTRVLDVKEAHAEALDINAWIDDLTQNGVISKRLDVFCIRVREDDHAEALEMNMDFDEARYPDEYAQEQFKEIDPQVRGEVIAAAHVEVLEMNEGFDCRASAHSFKAATIEACHAEALEMNAGYKARSKQKDTGDYFIDNRPLSMAGRKFYSSSNNVGNTCGSSRRTPG